MVETTIDPALQNGGREARWSTTLAQKGEKFGVGQGALVAMTPDGARARAGRRHATMPRASSTAPSRPSASPARRSSRSSISPRSSAGSRPTRCARTSRSRSRAGSRRTTSHEYFGPVTLTQALAHSLNTVVGAADAWSSGPPAVMRTAYRLGITSKLEPNASIALGTSEVSPLELVSAYAPFANGGFAVMPHVVERVRTADGKTLYARPTQALGRIVDARYVAMMNAMMQRDARDRHRAQGRPARLAGGRQDRHQPGFPRRLVHRLHRPPRHRRLARQRRQSRRPARRPAAACRSRSGAGS